MSPAVAPLFERETSSSPSPYYLHDDEYDLYSQHHSTNDSGQPPDEQDAENEYQQVDHPLAYLSDHVGFLPLRHGSHA